MSPRTQSSLQVAPAGQGGQGQPRPRPTPGTPRFGLTFQLRRPLPPPCGIHILEGHSGRHWTTEASVGSAAFGVRPESGHEKGAGRARAASGDPGQRPVPMTLLLAALITNHVPDRCWRPGLRSSRSGLRVSHFPSTVRSQTESPGRPFHTGSRTLPSSIPVIPSTTCSPGRLDPVALTSGSGPNSSP